jgi:hypothetical protein
MYKVAHFVENTPKNIVDGQTDRQTDKKAIVPFGYTGRD